MNNDVYNNKKGSSLEEAYAKLREAQAMRNASAKQQQYDTTNGVALNTTPFVVNRQQATNVSLQDETTQQQEEQTDANWAIRLAGTITQGLRNFGSAFLKLGEGGIDALIGLYGLFDAEGAEKAIKFDATNAIMEWEAENFSINALYKNQTGKNLYDESWLNDADEKVRNIVVGVEQGLGSAVGMGALSAIPVVGIAVAGTAAGGVSLEEALNDPEYNGSYLGALGYGIGSGVFEAGIEMLSAGVGKVLSGVAKKTGIKWLESGAGIVFGDYKGKNLGAKLVTALSQAVSEGGEEVASELINPVIKTFYTNDSVEESWKKNFSEEQIQNAFITGALSSLVLGGATAGINTASDSIAYGKSESGVSNADLLRDAQEIQLEMYEMYNNQNSYTEQEYSQKMTKLVNKQLEIYNKLGSTSARKQANIENTVAKQQEAIIQYGKELATEDKNYNNLTNINQVVNKIKKDGLYVNGKLDNDTIREVSGALGFNTNTVGRVNELNRAINSNKKLAKALKVKFIASDQIETTKDGYYVNAKYNSKTNEITFSQLITPDKAFNFYVGHELFHHFFKTGKLDDISSDVLINLKQQKGFENKYQDKVNKGYNQSEINEEILADYFGELVTKSSNFEKMFIPKSLAQKMADYLKNIRKDSYDEWARSKLADAISKLTNAKEYAKEIKQKAVAYNQQGVLINDDGVEKYNLASWFEKPVDKYGNTIETAKTGRQTFEENLKKAKYSKEDIQLALKRMDELAAWFKDLETEYGSIIDWNKTKIIYDVETKKSIFSSMIKNGEYPLNIDLSTICRKRKEMTQIINLLATNGLLDKVNLDVNSIVKINKILFKHNLQIACPACFVETKRVGSQKWAKDVADVWNNILKEVAIGEIQTLDFINNKTTANTQVDISKLDDIIKYGKTSENDAYSKLARIMKNNPSTRGTLNINDLMSSIGMDAIKMHQSNLYSGIVAKSGSATPKPITNPKPYDNSLAYITDLKDKSSQVGGVRMFSFSDFEILQLFDYMQVVADLHSNKATMQTYTKVIAFAKIFGMTGIKINLSLIPKVDATLGKENAGFDKNGNLWFDDHFSVNFDEAKALMDDNRYNGNVGTATIGISDKHIRALLDNPYTNYIIPYHRSGIKKVFAQKMGVDYFTDYTLSQNTRKYTPNKNGKKAWRKLSEDEAKGFNFFKELEKVKDARKMADNYLKWCKKNGYMPKFDTPTRKFSDHPNYYKLLVDFQVYKNVDGKEVYAPQQVVQMNYPDELDRLVRNELDREEAEYQLHLKEFPQAQKEILGVLNIKEEDFSYSKGELIELAGEYTDIGQEKQQTDLFTEQKLKELQNSNITYTANGSKVANTMKKLARQSYKDTTGFKNEVKSLTRQWVESIRVDGKTLHTFFGFEKDSREIKLMITEIVNRATNDFVNNTYNSVDARENLINRMIETTINDFTRQVRGYRNANVRSRKVVVKLKSNIDYFKEIVKDNKQYKKGKLEGLGKDVFGMLSKLKFTATVNLQADARTAISELYKQFLTNELVKPYLTEEQIEFATQAQKYLEARANQFKDLAKKPALNTENELDYATYSEEYPALVGLTEAEIVNNMLVITKRAINDSNNKQIEWDDKLVEAKDVAQKEVELQVKEGRTNKLIKKNFFSMLKDFILSVVDTRAYMNVMAHGNSNSAMLKIYERLVQAQSKTYENQRKLMKGLWEYFQTPEGKAIGKTLKDTKKKITFGGKEITIGQAISLAMASETDNALSHLVRGGVKIYDENGNQIVIQGSDFLNYLSQEQLEEFNLIKESTKEDDKVRRKELYVEAIENARNDLYTKVGDKYTKLINILKEGYRLSGDIYIEASEQITGMHYGLKSIYYPTSSDPYDFNLDIAKEDSREMFVNETMNPSFTKATIKGASNPLLIGDVLDTYYNFVNKLSTYSGVTVEVKNLQKLLNSRVEVKNLDRKITLYEYLDTNVDRSFTKYFKELTLAMQNIKTKQTTKADKIVRWMRSMGAKMALGANVKTVLTQFTAYTKGYLYISANNLAKAFNNKRKRTTDGLLDFKWARENSAFINNRYVNSNVYNIESIGAFDKVSMVTDMLMKPIEKADELTLAKLWDACQYQCMENGKVDHQKALELFEKVVRETQAQYDAIGNGSLARIDNEIVKSFLMFSSENRKTLSRLVEAIYMVSITKKGTAEHKQAVNFLAKNCATTLASATMVAMIATFLKQLKGDYDDKEKEEIVKEILLEEFGANIVGMIPFVKDLYNYFVSGYDLQLGGFSQVTDLLKVFSDYLPTLLDINSDNDERRTALIQTITKICHFFGIPARNIINNVLYTAGLLDIPLKTDIVLKLKNFFYNTTNANYNTYLKTYTSRGQTEKAATVIQLKFSNYISGDIDDKSAKEMARLYSNGVLTSFPSQISDEVTHNGETITLTKAQKSHAKEIYSIANDILPTMLNSSLYASLSDEEKAKAIDKLFDTYYDLAKQSVFTDYEPSRLAQIANYVKLEKFATALAKINGITETKTATKKVMVQRYINGLSMKASEKYLLLYLAGYSLSSEKQATVQALLKQSGMTYREAKEFFA